MVIISKWQARIISKIIFALLVVVAWTVGRWSLESFRNSGTSRRILLDDIPNKYTGHYERVECPIPQLKLRGQQFREPSFDASIYSPRIANLPTCLPSTPLFVAFTSMEYLLHQAVLSFIAEGWPPSQIVVLLAQLSSPCCDHKESWISQ
jgi:hypothetical protein